LIPLLVAPFILIFLIVFKTYICRLRMQNI
jgi:hypothetical protein